MVFITNESLSHSCQARMECMFTTLTNGDDGNIDYYVEYGDLFVINQINA